MTISFFGRILMFVTKVLLNIFLTTSKALYIYNEDIYKYYISNKKKGNVNERFGHRIK